MAKGGLSVKVLNAEEVQRALKDAASSIHKAAADAVGQEVDAVAGDMRDTVPVVTGELRESIRGEHDGLSGRAAATARHAAFVEFGTSKAPAQPYASPSAETSRRRFPGRVEDAITSELK